MIDIEQLESHLEELNVDGSQVIVNNEYMIFTKYKDDLLSYVIYSNTKPLKIINEFTEIRDALRYCRIDFY